MSNPIDTALKNNEDLLKALVHVAESPSYTAWNLDIVLAGGFETLREQNIPTDTVSSHSPMLELWFTIVHGLFARITEALHNTGQLTKGGAEESFTDQLRVYGVKDPESMIMFLVTVVDDADWRMILLDQVGPSGRTWFTTQLLKAGQGLLAVRVKAGNDAVLASVRSAVFVIRRTLLAQQDLLDLEDDEQATLGANIDDFVAAAS